MIWSHTTEVPDTLCLSASTVGSQVEETDAGARAIAKQNKRSESHIEAEEQLLKETLENCELHLVSLHTQNPVNNQHLRVLYFVAQSN